MHGYSTCIIALLCLFTSARATAQDTASAATVPPVETTTAAAAEEVDAAEESAWELTGAVDGYYMYNFNETGFPTSFTALHNTFTLGMANLILKKEGKVGFVADLAFGPRAEAANGRFADESGLLPTLSAIKQLYVTYSPTEAVTFTFGNFGTFVGYELIDATGNINYSTSYLFSNGPFYHTGLKANVALGESFGFMLGVFNDTDNKFDPVPGKHVGAQLSASQGKLSAYLNFLYGKDAELEGDRDVNELVTDLTATFAASDKLSLGLNVARYNKTLDGDGQGGYFGSALYASILPSEKFGLGLRGEYFNFDDGDDAIDNNSVIALTATGNIYIGNLRLIPEFRIDLGSEDLFETADGELVGNNSGLILAAVYAF